MVKITNKYNKYTIDYEENFVFNGVKAVQNVNSFYLEDKFKDYLKWERQMITNDIFYGKLSVDGQISKEEVHFSPELENVEEWQ